MPTSDASTPGYATCWPRFGSTRCRMARSGYRRSSPTATSGGPTTATCRRPRRAPQRPRRHGGRRRAASANGARLVVVALDEVEAPGVGREPGVRRGRAEVELGAVAVQRLARARDPARVRVAARQHGLLGVRAEGAGDQQRDAVGARRALHAVERLRDVRAHRLALAQRERAVVAAAGREARRAGGASSASRRATTARRSAAGRARRRRARGPPRGSGRARTSRRPGTPTCIGLRAVGAATRRAAARPSARYAALSRWRGFGRPSSTAGSNSRG